VAALAAARKRAGLDLSPFQNCNIVAKLMGAPIEASGRESSTLHAKANTEEVVSAKRVVGHTLPQQALPFGSEGCGE